MIWPFKRDPLESDADLLVGAVNTFAIGMFPKFIDEFPFVPHDERGQRYWDFVVTIAGQDCPNHPSSDCVGCDKLGVTRLRRNRSSR